MLKKNDVLQLHITGMTLHGDGVAKAFAVASTSHGGIAVFVPGVCPGDTIKALILKVKPRHAFGKCLEVISPSPQRADPQCDVFPRCGGCSFRCLSYQAELEFKQSETTEILRRIGKIDLELEPILGAQSHERYRNKALLPVCEREGKIRAGFYARHSHRVVCCDDCRLQPELFSRLAQAVCQWAGEVGCTVYDEATGRGLLRHIYLRSAQNCTQALVCLVVNGRGVPRADILISRLRAVSNAVKGVLLSHNTKDTNVVLGESVTLLWGQEHIIERLCGLEFTLSPLSFFQVNAAQAERLYRLAGEFAQLRGNEKLLDLYCGTGTIGLTMARGCAELVGVEIIPQAVEDARRNATHNQIDNARFICADAAKAAAQLAAENWQPDVVLIDPPRRGCELGLLQIIANMSPARIVYISCDPATLARDLAVLRDLGYEAKRIQPVDMFPRTGHVECVSLLEKL